MVLPRLSNFAGNLREPFREHALALNVTLLTFAVALVLLVRDTGAKGLLIVPLAMGGVAFSFVLIAALVKGLQYFFLMLWRYKPESPIRFLLSLLKDFVRSGRPFYNFIVIGIIFSVFATGFSINKALIPRLNPFSWDDYFTRLDYHLHLAAYPHTYLSWITESSFLLSSIDLIYQSWFYMYYFSIFCAAYYFYEKPEAKLYFLASCLTWAIGGNIIALIFSSAGPIFAEQVGRNPDYLAQLSLMSASDGLIPNLALIVRDKLWTSLESNGFSSISAFPSMHVASTVLMTIASFYTGSKILFRFMLVYCLLILVGSVVLMWHYAVDGYAGIFLAFLGWLAAKHLLRPANR